MLLYLASNNAHKLQEIRPALAGVEVLTPQDRGIDFDFPEDEASFIGNSLGKALALWKLVKAPVLADDSGLCVDALGGRPGVHSARYGSVDGITPLDATVRNTMLLDEMKDQADRSCRFVCCMSLVLSPDRVMTVQETCEGILLDEPRGKGGFGYDPVVYLPALGKSIAELSMEEKNRVSHRGRALAIMAALIVRLSQGA
ncbi:MAG: non-canonical purine NTP pyrophosphatase [Spirochaetia bacterium]|jgi:XTP/dITP diphosphohydrolase|nr:non-canonical purine NTP pyrophosphatase [Spirochaetia bacterium]